MIWVESLLEWFSRHKEGLIAFAALASPVISAAVALLAARTSYKATVTAPAAQKMIAAAQQELSREQLKLQQKLAVTSFIGAMDHKWIESFREKLAQSISTLSNIHTNRTILMENGPEIARYVSGEINGFTASVKPLLEEIELLCKEENGGRELIGVLTEMFTLSGNLDEWTRLRTRATQLGIAIIAERRSRMPRLLTGESG